MRPGRKRTARLEPTYGLDEALWLFSSFCMLHRVSFDAALFARQYPPPIDAACLQRAADELNLGAEHRNCSLDAAMDWQLPVAVRLCAAARADSPASASGAASDAPPDDSARWALVLNATDSQASILEHDAQTPVLVSLDELRLRFLGEALLLAPKASEPADPDSMQFARPVLACAGSSRNS